jgi:hypothetical protein
LDSVFLADRQATAKQKPPIDTFNDFFAVVGYEGEDTPTSDGGGSSGLTTAQIVGVVIGVCAALLLGMGVVYWCCCASAAARRKHQQVPLGGAASTAPVNFVRYEAVH